MMLLPTMRRKIFNSFMLLLAVFGGMGALMLVALSVTGGAPPALLHLNYDSIDAGHRMQEALDALYFPEGFPHLPAAAAAAQFNEALHFAEGNITESGELEAVRGIQQLWQRRNIATARRSLGDFRGLNEQLSALIRINEDAMFVRVARAKEISTWILIGNSVALVLTLFFAVFLSDSLATRLASPIKALAEALRVKPNLARPLSLPTPTSLELRILMRELRQMWESLGAANKVNVTEILQQKSKLEALLDSVEDGLLVLDEKQTVTHCNRLVEQLIGLPTAAVNGQAWGDLSSANPNYLLLRDILREGGAFERETQLQVGSGVGNFQIRCRAIVGRADESLGRLVLLRDITEKRQRERLRSELIDLLSHELKTPLQSLGMAAEMLTRHKDEIAAQSRFLIDTINDDIGRLRAVAQQFIQATQTRSLLLALKRVDLKRIVPDWLKPFVLIAHGRGVELRFRCEEPAEVWALIDATKFPWAISNLLSNAIRVSDAGEAVEVSVAVHGDGALIEVADAGPGIPVEVRRRMYDAFYQGPELPEVVSGEAEAPASADAGLAGAPAGKPVRGMLGVGLTIAKEVVEGHGGRLDYRERVPHGSIFSVYVPSRAEER